MMHIESRIETKDILPGAIGRHHHIDGVARFNDAFDGAEVVITRTRETNASKIMLAQAHEHGHVGTFADIVPNSRKHAAENTDRFKLEVEAWLRGFERIHDSMLSRFESFAFVLDCLNSYRRNLDVSDEHWNDSVALIASYWVGSADGAQRILEYMPLEPDPTEEPPVCVRDANGEPIGKGSDGDGSYNPNDEGLPPEYNENGTGDNRWLRQDILDDLRKGEYTVEDAAEIHDLPLDRLPALIEAMR